MWYFAWVLGLGLAVTVAILNGIWHEFNAVPRNDRSGVE
jgi:cyd operon protein YbgT